MAGIFVNSLNLFFEIKDIDKTGLVQHSQIFQEGCSKGKEPQKENNKVIHKEKLINEGFVSYTPSYPHYPPTEWRSSGKS